MLLPRSINPGLVLLRPLALGLKSMSRPSYVLAIADHGWQRALRADAHLRNGLNICRGRVTHPAVARDLDLPFTSPDEMTLGHKA